MEDTGSVLTLYLPDKGFVDDGLVIGWISGQFICIADVVDVEDSIILNKIDSINSNTYAVAYWGSKLGILGRLSKDRSTDDSHYPYMFACGNENRIELVAVKDSIVCNPIVHMIYYDTRKLPYFSGTFVIPQSLALRQINTSSTVVNMIRAKDTSKCGVFKIKPPNIISWYYTYIVIHILYIFLPFVKILKRTLQTKWAFLYPKDVSLFCLTLENRCNMICTMVEKWEYLNQPEVSWKLDEVVQKEWINLYSTAFSLSMDYVLGLWLVLWNLPSKRLFTTTISSNITKLWGFDILTSGIQWIMEGSPGGIKLSGPASLALGTLFSFYIQRWATVMDNTSAISPYLIRIVSTVGILGISPVLSLIHDVLYFINMHIYWLYISISRICRTFITVVTSLWLLLRGKKRNVLKNRVDSYDYSLDQLIFGTLLFAGFILLLPTVMMYYFLFLLAMIGIIVFQWIFQAMISLVNDFPIYTLFLYLIRSQSLNGSVYLEFKDVGELKQNSKVTHFKLYSRSVGLSKLFGKLSLTPISFKDSFSWKSLWIPMK